MVLIYVSSRTYKWNLIKAVQMVPQAVNLVVNVMMDFIETHSLVNTEIY